MKIGPRLKVLSLMTVLWLPLAAIWQPVMARSTEEVARLADSWLQSKGWTRGFDADGRLVVVTTAAVALPVSNPAYVTARNAAFDLAMNDARRRAVETLSAQIKTRADQKLDLTEIIDDPEAARVLTGVASDEAYRISQEFSDAIEVAATAALSGFYAVQTFESVDASGNAELAVVATISLKSPDISLRPTITGGPGSDRLATWFATIDDASLARTFGIRFARSDENVLSPIAFGQARLRPEPAFRDAAEQVAVDDAIGRLADLIGQSIASKTLSATLSKVQSSTAMSGDVAKFMNRADYAASIKLNSEARFGTEIVGRRVLRDPASGSELVVVAVTIARSDAPMKGSSSPTDGVGGPATSSAPTRSADTDVVGNCPPVPDNMAASVRQVRVVATGKSRDMACETALLEAVRREGADVKGSTILERQYKEAVEVFAEKLQEKVTSNVDQSSKVETFADGFIYSYDVVRESAKEGSFEVEICANMVRFDPKDPRFGLPPTVAVLPFECADGAVQVGGRPEGCSEVAGKCESMLTAALNGLGSYMVLSELERPRLVELRDDIERRVQNKRADQAEALKLGNELTPDFVLVGRIVRAEFTGAPGLRPQKINASDVAAAEISVEFLDVATGRVLWSDQASTMLRGREILQLRAGTGLQDPSESSMSPLQVAVFRTIRALIADLQTGLPTPSGQ